eukprot:g10996.t1
MGEWTEEIRPGGGGRVALSGYGATNTLELGGRAEVAALTVVFHDDRHQFLGFFARRLAAEHRVLPGLDDNGNNAESNGGGATVAPSVTSQTLPQEVAPTMAISPDLSNGGHVAKTTPAGAADTAAAGSGLVGPSVLITPPVQRKLNNKVCSGDPALSAPEDPFICAGMRPSAQEGGTLQPLSAADDPSISDETSDTLVDVRAERENDEEDDDDDNDEATVNKQEDEDVSSEEVEDEEEKAKQEKEEGKEDQGENNGSREESGVAVTAIRRLTVASWVSRASLLVFCITIAPAEVVYHIAVWLAGHFADTMGMIAGLRAAALATGMGALLSTSLSIFAVVYGRSAFKGGADMGADATEFLAAVTDLTSPVKNRGSVANPWKTPKQTPAAEMLSSKKKGVAGRAQSSYSDPATSSNGFVRNADKEREDHQIGLSVDIAELAHEETDADTTVVDFVMVAAAADSIALPPDVDRGDFGAVEKGGSISDSDVSRGRFEGHQDTANYLLAAVNDTECPVRDLGNCRVAQLKDKGKGEGDDEGPLKKREEDPDHHQKSERLDNESAGAAPAPLPAHVTTNDSIQHMTTNVGFVSGAKLATTASFSTAPCDGTRAAVPGNSRLSAVDPEAAHSVVLSKHTTEPVTTASHSTAPGTGVLSIGMICLYAAVALMMVIVGFYSFKRRRHIPRRLCEMRPFIVAWASRTLPGIAPWLRRGRRIIWGSRAQASMVVTTCLHRALSMAIL